MNLLFLFHKHLQTQSYQRNVIIIDGLRNLHFPETSERLSHILPSSRIRSDTDTRTYSLSSFCQLNNLLSLSLSLSLSLFKTLYLYLYVYIYIYIYVYLYRNGYGTDNKMKDTPMWFLEKCDSIVHLFSS